MKKNLAGALLIVMVMVTASSLSIFTANFFMAEKLVELARVEFAERIHTVREPIDLALVAARKIRDDALVTAAENRATNARLREKKLAQNSMTRDENLAQIIAPIAAAPAPRSETLAVVPLEIDWSMADDLELRVTQLEALLGDEITGKRGDRLSGKRGNGPAAARIRADIALLKTTLTSLLKVRSTFEVKIQDFVLLANTKIKNANETQLTLPNVQEERRIHAAFDDNNHAAWLAFAAAEVQVNASSEEIHERFSANMAEYSVKINAILLTTSPVETVGAALTWMVELAAKQPLYFSLVFGGLIVFWSVSLVLLCVRVSREFSFGKGTATKELPAEGSSTTPKNLSEIVMKTVRRIQDRKKRSLIERLCRWWERRNLDKNKESRRPEHRDFAAAILAANRAVSSSPSNDWLRKPSLEKRIAHGGSRSDPLTNDESDASGAPLSVPSKKVPDCKSYAPKDLSGSIPVAAMVIKSEGEANDMPPFHITYVREVFNGSVVVTKIFSVGEDHWVEYPKENLIRNGYFPDNGYVPDTTSLYTLHGFVTSRWHHTENNDAVFLVLERLGMVLIKINKKETSVILQGGIP